MTKKLLLPADINTRANNSSIDQAVILSARPIFNSLLIAGRIAGIPTLRLLTVIIGSGSGSGSSGTHTYGHPTAHWGAIGVMVVHTAVMTAYVTSGTAPSPSRRGFVRKGHDSCDADDNGDSQ